MVRRWSIYAVVPAMLVLLVYLTHHPLTLPSPDEQLVTALFQDDLEGVVTALDRGAAPDAQSPDGTTALMMAAQWGRQRSMDSLIAHGARLDLQDPYGRTALIWAASSGRSHQVRTLLFRGANPAILDHQGHSALYHALAREDPETLDLLRCWEMPISATSPDAD